MMSIYLSFSIKNTFSKNVKGFSNFLSISLPPKPSPPLQTRKQSLRDKCLTRCLRQLSFLQDVLDNVYDNCDAGYKYRKCIILKESYKEHR
jgi:hypothetical protein